MGSDTSSSEPGQDEPDRSSAGPPSRRLGDLIRAAVPADRFGDHLAILSGTGQNIVGLAVYVLATFGTNVLTSAGSNSDLFVAKLDSSGGSWHWARSTGGTNQPDSANALAVSQQGSVFVAGHFRGTASFGTNSLVSTSGSQDVFVAKLDLDGNWLWARAAGRGPRSAGAGRASP